jgi:hypothetical protein
MSGLGVYPWILYKPVLSCLGKDGKEVGHLQSRPFLGRFYRKEVSHLLSAARELHVGSARVVGMLERIPKDVDLPKVKGTPRKLTAS